MSRDARETRRRLIEAADALFYSEGVHGVGVDRIAERARVTKRTLYYHFESKDELIAAYLAARDGPQLERFQGWFRSSRGTVGARFTAVFKRLAEAARDPRWRGCAFARAAAELAGLPGHPARAVASDHKHTLEAWLARLLAAERIDDAPALARQLMIIVDGAVTQILVHRDPQYAEAAGRAATALIDAAIAVRDRRGASSAGLSRRRA